MTKREKLIEARNAIEAEPVRHGRWIGEKCNHKPYRIKNPEKWVTYKCSVCGYSNGRKQSNYCPNCGAKMDALTFEEASRKLGQQAAETLRKLKEEGHAGDVR